MAAEERGVGRKRLAGTIQNDIQEFLTRNTYIYHPASMRIVSGIIAYSSKNMPRYNTVSISYHGGWADSVLQTAFADRRQGYIALNDGGRNR